MPVEVYAAADCHHDGTVSVLVVWNVSGYSLWICSLYVAEAEIEQHTKRLRNPVEAVTGAEAVSYTHLSGGNNFIVFYDYSAVASSSTGASLCHGSGNVKIIVDFIYPFMIHIMFLLS